jgi:hypothetical protein
MKLSGIYLLILFPCIALSQGNSRGASNLKIPISPFVASTGEAFVADPEEMRSLIINPANIASYENYGIMFSHTQWVQDIRTEFLAAVIPFRFGSMALSIANNSVNGLELRTMPGPAIGTFDVQFTGFQLSYGLKINDAVKIGLSPKYLYEKIFIDETTGFGLDAGLIYTPPVDGLLIGLSVTNLGSLSAFHNERIDLPTQIRLGGTYMLNLEKFAIRTALAYSPELGLSVGHFNSGIETIYDNLVSLRFGYKTGYDFAGFSAGLGIRYNPVTIDYAYVPSAMQVGDAHIFSIAIAL